MRSVLKALSPFAILVASVPCVEAQTVLATFNYPQGVTGVAVDYVANRAYALAPNFSNGQNAIQVLDGKSNTAISTFTTAGLSSAIAVNVVTGLVYVGGVVPSSTNPSGIQANVAAINPRTGAVVATIPVTATVGYGIVALAVDPFTNRIFVSNDSDNVITVINGKTNTVASVVSLNGQTPNGLAVNFFTGKVYAALNDSQVAIIREKDDSVTYATFGSQTAAVAVDPVLNREYVTDAVFDTPTVGVLSAKGATVASVPVGIYPQGLDLDFVTSTVYVANEADGTITKIDAWKNSVLATIPIAANSIAVNPREATVYAVGPTSVTVFTEK